MQNVLVLTSFDGLMHDLNDVHAKIEANFR